MLLQKTSDAQISTLTNVSVFVIEASDLFVTYQTSLLANKLGRVATENLFLKKVKREKDLLTKTSEERYQDFLREYPEVISQIPIKNIAMYLVSSQVWIMGKVAVNLTLMRFTYCPL